MHVLDLIKTSLLEDREEASQHGEPGPTDAAIATCMGIMGSVSPCNLLSSRLTWAAFGEDTGGVSLVARSLATNRRADFCISPDGLSVSAVYIDEHAAKPFGLLDNANSVEVDRITQWLNDSWGIGCGGIGCERPGSITGRPSR